jgi:hypothetical protein
MRVISLLVANPADRNKERNKLLKSRAPSLGEASAEARRAILRRRLHVLFGKSRELTGSQLNDLYLRIFHENIRSTDYPTPGARLKDVLKDLTDTFAIKVAPMGQMSVKLLAPNANLGGPGLGTNDFLHTTVAEKIVPHTQQGHANGGSKVRSPPPNAVCRICWQWPRCKFGDSCVFAHGPEELAEWGRVLRGSDGRPQGPVLENAGPAPVATGGGTASGTGWRCGAEGCGHTNAPGAPKCTKCGRQAETAWEARLTTFSKEALGYLLSQNVSDTDLAHLPQGVSVELDTSIDGPLPPVLHLPSNAERGVVAAHAGSTTVEWTVRLKSQRPLNCARLGLLMPNLRQWRLVRAEGVAAARSSQPVQGLSRGEANTFVFSPPLPLGAGVDIGHTLVLTVQEAALGP